MNLFLMNKSEWMTDHTDIDFSSIEKIAEDFYKELVELLARRVFFNSDKQFKQRFHDLCHDIITDQIFTCKGWEDVVRFVHGEYLSFGLNSIELQKDDAGVPIISSRFMVKADEWNFIVYDYNQLGPDIKDFEDYELSLWLDSLDYYYLYFRLWFLSRLPEYIYNDKKIERIIYSFEILFKKESNADKLKIALHKHTYIDEKNIWIGNSGKKTELLALYCALQEHEIIRKINNITGARIFYEEFGLPVGNVKDGNYISERSFNNPPNKGDSLDFNSFVINLYDLK